MAFMAMDDLDRLPLDSAAGFWEARNAAGVGQRRSIMESSCPRARMKRRSFRRLRAGSSAAVHHHHVYVVLLDPAVARFRNLRSENPDRDPAKPCVYVGMTGLTPEERFANHKRGDKASSIVRRFGVRLLPELYAHLNPMPFAAAAVMERELAEDLRNAGYTVTGGH